MSWTIDIPTQGIKVYGDKDKIVDFLNKEVAYFGRLAMDNTTFIFGDRNFGLVGISQQANQALSEIINDVNKNKIEALERYIADADARQVLVGASPTGKRVEELKDTSQGVAALIVACIFSPKWVYTQQNVARDVISIFRAVAFANPANFGFDDLVTASRAVERSAEAELKSNDSSRKLDDFIKEKTELVADLEDLYRKRLTIQEPALSWKNIAEEKTRAWRAWLIGFGFAAVMPAVVALFDWQSVSSAVTKITAASNGAFSISGLAVISIPALFYAWFLKNISRLFIQNLTLADDADHRRSLALTYMGLLQDDKHPPSDQDRAIILNALFRPIPTQSGDEGPPAGLIELVKK